MNYFRIIFLIIFIFLTEFAYAEISEKSLKNGVDDLARRLPMRIDGVTTIKSVALLSGGKIQYSYQFDLDGALENAAKSLGITKKKLKIDLGKKFGTTDAGLREWFKQKVETDFVKINCTTPETQNWIRNGVVLVHTIYDLKNNFLYETSVTNEQCSRNVGNNVSMSETLPTISRDYIVSNGFIINLKKRLVFSICLVGQQWNGQNCLGTPQMYFQNEVFTPATLTKLAPYRIPTSDELNDLYKYYAGNSEGVFPSNQCPAKYWMDSDSAVDKGAKGVLYYCYGRDQRSNESFSMNMSGKSMGAFVRLVRAWKNGDPE